MLIKPNSFTNNFTIQECLFSGQKLIIPNSFTMGNSVRKSTWNQIVS